MTTNIALTVKVYFFKDGSPLLYMETSISKILGSLRNALENQKKSKIEIILNKDVWNYITLLGDWMDESLIEKNRCIEFLVFLQKVHLDCTGYLLDMKEERMINDLENYWSKLLIQGVKERRNCNICGWTNCLCDLGLGMNDITFGFQLNENLLMEDGHINPGLDAVSFLVKYAKQRCKRCFISHMPKHKWCNKHKPKEDRPLLKISCETEKYFQKDPNVKMIQLDGLDDDIGLEFDTTVPHCLGTVDCHDETMFFVLNLFRGFEKVWNNFSSHHLCDYKRTASRNHCCTLCLVRSFSIRVNEIKTKGGKRMIKPNEVFSELLSILPLISEINCVETTLFQ